VSVVGSQRKDSPTFSQKSTTLTNGRRGSPPRSTTVEHETCQEQINNYLQGRPDDVWMWLAGYRMQFFAQRGLVGPPRTGQRVPPPWYAAGGVVLPGVALGAAGLAMPALDPEQALLLRVGSVAQ
jgi:hypothetical protein